MREGEEKRGGGTNLGGELLPGGLAAGGLAGGLLGTGHLLLVSGELALWLRLRVGNVELELESDELSNGMTRGGGSEIYRWWVGRGVTGQTWDRGGFLLPFGKGFGVRLDLTAEPCLKEAHDPCASCCELWLVESEEVRIDDVALGLDTGVVGFVRN
jgi:hypothetical protein